MTAPTPAPTSPLKILVLDASVMLAWILQKAPLHTKIDRLLGKQQFDFIAPVPALTEVLYGARQHGNPASYRQLSAALGSAGIRTEPTLAEDALWAADRIAESRANPASWTTAKGEKRGPLTLSLVDGLILATAHRLGAVALTLDEAWFYFPTMQLRAISAWKLPWSSGEPARTPPT